MADDEPYHALAVRSAQESSKPVSTLCSAYTRPDLFESVNSHRYTSYPVHDFFGKVCDDAMVENVLQGTCWAVIVRGQFGPLDTHYI